MVVKYFTRLNVLQVVPPDQARKIYKALKESGLPVALVEYEGEQHGFRKVWILYSLPFSTFKPCQLLRWSWISTSFSPHFEQAENIMFTLEQQMVFFAQTVGKFKVADDITPIKIENFDWCAQETSVAVVYIS